MWKGEHMWTIGIIDDDERERADIQVAVWESVERKEEIGFKEYELACRKKEDLFQEILEDVTEEKIHTLIVDYRLDTTDIVFKGWEIVEYIHTEVPEFPVIIMTNAPEESKESPYIDADKVYPKIVFLLTESKASAELVKNIILNIRRYEKRRKDLEGRLAVKLSEMSKKSTDEEVIREVLNLENQLGKYKEMDQTVLDQTFDFSEVKDVLNELKSVEGLLGE